MDNLNSSSSSSSSLQVIIEAPSQQELDSALLDLCRNYPSGYTGHLYSVSAYLAKGANIEAVDEDGNTPLHLACQQNDKPLVEYLVR